MIGLTGKEGVYVWSGHCIESAEEHPVVGVLIGLPGLEVIQLAPVENGHLPFPTVD